MPVILRPFTEPEYHLFFQHYEADPLMEPLPYKYNRENVSRSFEYNYRIRTNYAHFGIFLDEKPVGCFQLKRIDKITKQCEFGIILQNDNYKNHGIGTEAIQQGMIIAKKDFLMKKILGDTSSKNLRMVRVFEKLSFQLIETVHDAFIYEDGRKADRLIYQRDLKHWKER